AARRPVGAGGGVVAGLRYVGWRLAQLLPTVAGIVVVGFVLIHLAPGDPVLALAGEHGDAAYYAFMREKFGLDRPLPEQLLTYAGRVLRGDLGNSYVQGRSAAAVIAERLPATLLLTSTALVVSSLAGVAVGVYAAARPYGRRDVTITAGTLCLYAAPVFWVGQLSLLVLALHTGLFPVQGMTSAASTAGGVARLADIARHLTLPALVLASQELAAVARLTRVGLLDELRADHVLTARAKGLAERTVVLKHGLRRALLPVVTVIGGRVGHLISGTVVVEVVFGWPGLGRLLLAAMQSRDLPIVLGIFLLVGFSVVLANLLTDLVYGWLDPRIRYR
ncbi:MAG TPA: ABC transporter permease, partial [Egibacteraceae bacterium]|nr:ABC transporter permease [Egibacteraceae bacterium]